MALRNVGTTTRLCIAGLGRSVLVVSLILLLGGCQQPEPSVQSYLEGRVVVDSSTGTSDDASGFRVRVLRPDGRRIDTLGDARTDGDGRFRMPIAAPSRGIYALSFWSRNGRTPLATTDYVVASGDSATLRVDLPSDPPLLRPESPENQALRSYQNMRAMPRRMRTRRERADTDGASVSVQNIRLTSSTLWRLRDRYPGTYAGQIAAVESLSLLEGWNDSLVVARARQIAPSSPRYVDAVRIARRAEARLHGHRAALDLLDTFEADAAHPRDRAGVKAARIQAFLDSMQVEAALSAAQQLRAEHAHSPWTEWARRVRYEAHNLQPGMRAPNLTVRTLEGDTLSLRDLRGRPVVLEYYRPGTDLYTLQRPLRNTLYEATRPDSVAFVSISIEPDSLVNRAYLRNQRLPGHTVIAAQGPEDPLATRYNVVQVPAWIFIDEAGRIVDRYRASALPTLRHRLLHQPPDTAVPPTVPTR